MTEPIKPASPFEYIPQLDGLRAVAVIGVMMTHFCSTHYIYFKYLDTGWLGVRLFFVLSGFLICSILLHAKSSCDSAHVGKILLSFYARRLLRLSPIYYLYLLASIWFLPGAIPYLSWFVVYLQNFLFAFKPYVFGKYLAHFWTLAVEEQFYLLAPWLLLTLSIAQLRYVLPMVVVTGFLFPGLCQLVGMTPFQASMMMPSHADALGAGALLALLRREHDRLLDSPLFSILIGGLGGLIFLVVAIVKEFGYDTIVISTLGSLGQVALFVWIIDRTSRSKSTYVSTILQFSPLVFLGKISYGIYVYHFNVPGLLREKILPALGIGFPEDQTLRFFLCATVSIGIATVSWYLLEQPLTRFKRFFPYR